MPKYEVTTKGKVSSKISGYTVPFETKDTLDANSSGDAIISVVDCHLDAAENQWANLIIENISCQELN